MDILFADDERVVDLDPYDEDRYNGGEEIQVLWLVENDCN